MDSDTSDILGGPTFPHVRDSQSGWWSSLPFGAKLVFALMVSFVFYVAFVRMREIFLVWREKAYKLSMRRRHGIPDNDHRPFNVAYAAVLRSRQEGEEKARRARLQELIQDQQSAPPDQDSRQRILRGASTKLNPLPGRYESADMVSYGRASGSNHLRPLFVSNLDAEDNYNPNPAVRIADPEITDSPPKSSLSRRAVKDSSRKHVHNGGDESKYTREMRVKDGDDLRGDQELEWIEEHGSPRGWKRGHGDNLDDDEVDGSLHIRDKRQRKVSLDKSSQLADEDMDIDEDEDEISALPSLSRGKKRDRAEAGSTFGGDDEDDGDHEIDLEKARHRHRKRRTYAKRKSDASVSARGTKRDRELAEGDSESENEGNMSLKTSRKKRGKKAARAPQPDDRSDVSMDESLASSSRSRQRRNIGDEWESNGVKYKAGPNGQRLRQTLIRKERQKFPMPEDSQHPDRQANFEVYVETWLTEEEYREAKDQQLLAWQDSNKPSAEPQTPTIESPEEVPLVAGKDLLWNSTSSYTQPGGTSTPRQISPPVTPQTKQRSNDSSGSFTALGVSVGPRVNPFANPPPAGKRISTVRRPSSLKVDGASIVPSSLAGSIVHSLSDSTNNSPRHKAFSKWEKQDLEAKAMMKMRQANRVKEEERSEKLKKEQEAAAASSKVIPTITVTTVDDAKPSETKQPAFFFAAPPVADSAKKDAPNPSSLAGPAKETTQIPLPAQTTSQQTTKLPTVPGPVTTAGIQPTKATGGLFGSKSEQLNSFVSFGPSSAASMSSSTAPATSASTSTIPAIPPPKPAFSFGPPPSQAQPTQTTKESEMKKNESAAGGSLLSRLAPSSTPMPTVQATQPPQATSPFGSSKPFSMEAPKTASAFGNPNTAQSSSSQLSTANTGPKFDFGLGKPPVGATMATTSSAATSGSSATKSAASPFTFATSSSTADNGSAATSSTAPASAPTDSTTTAPKFSFSIPSTSSSPNSFAPKSNGTHTSTATTTAPVQSAFSFGPKPVGTTLAPSPFGAFGAQNAPAAPATTTPPIQSSFGSKPNGSSTTPPVQPVFGTQQASATAPTQSVFSFGTKPSDNSSTPSAFGTQTTTGASAPAPVQSASTTGSTSFAFGSSSGFGSKPSGDSSSAPAPAQSAFGGGGFGGSNNNSTSTGSPFGAGFSFGKPATNPVAPAPAASKDNSSKPIFSFGKPAAASSSTTPLMTPSSTPAPTSTGGPSAFGTTFGSSSSSAFTFGNAAKNPSIPPQTSTDSPFGKPADASAFGFGGGNTFSGFGKAPASTGQQQQ
ncbi:hypothetical protein C0992_010119 [Termitomyces sp. T32_za158]|nr:hypothetical protein C0992_010119 [Termitomyces sp. T32_za158]